MTYPPEQAYALSAERNEAIFRKSIVGMMEKYPAYGTWVAQPRAWILGGQPGAGKSTIAGNLGFAERAVQISTDQFRVEHDKWTYLLDQDDETDGRIWVDKAANHLIEQSANVLVDATLSNPEYAGELISKFKAAKYRVKVVFVATPRPVSLLSNVMRYQILSGPEGFPARTCMRATYSEMCDGVLRTAGRIDRCEIPVDAVRVYCRRTSEELYRNDDWSEPIWDGAAEAIKAEQIQKWDRDYTRNFLAAYSKLRAEMAWRGPRWDPWFADIKALASPLLAYGHNFISATEPTH
jgi:adenylate kinase family enzyme